MTKNYKLPDVRINEWEFFDTVEVAHNPGDWHYIAMIMNVEGSDCVSIGYKGGDAMALFPEEKQSDILARIIFHLDYETDTNDAGETRRYFNTLPPGVDFHSIDAPEDITKLRASACN